MDSIAMDMLGFRYMANLKEWKNTMDEMDCGVPVTVFISIFYFLNFVFHFLFFGFLVPSSLIRCEFLASCTLFEVLDCVYICPWPGDCNQRESRVVALEN